MAPWHCFEIDTMLQRSYAESSSNLRARTRKVIQSLPHRPVNERALHIRVLPSKAQRQSYQDNQSAISLHRKVRYID